MLLGNNDCLGLRILKKIIKYGQMSERIHSKEILDPGDVTIIMPVGGLGTRAREYTRDLIPKPLIPLDENLTVLDIVCLSLIRRGFNHFVFCIGQHGEQIANRLENRKTVLDLNKTRYEFSYEDKPLGADGAILQALERFEVRNPSISIPGDMFLPWDSIIELLRFHSREGSDITFALTSVITENTVDVGKIWIDENSNEVVRCFARQEETPTPPSFISPLTSAAMFAINPTTYKRAYFEFRASGYLPDGSKVDFRDNLLPWLLANPNYIIKGYDVKGEALDIGTPERITYAQANWKTYL